MAEACHIGKNGGRSPGATEEKDAQQDIGIKTAQMQALAVNSCGRSLLTRSALVQRLTDVARRPS